MLYRKSVQSNSTDVLIIGGGPTGLMMACQLLRFNIPFRIIDKQADRAHESRAFGIQAKSMEIFQNLGVLSQFLEAGLSGIELNFFINGKKKAEVKFGNLGVEGTPFPWIHLLPQSETERILNGHIEAYRVAVERQKELVSFTQDEWGVQAQIKDALTETIEHVRCRYIIGCDGAHSTVRHALNLPFEGAPYPQEFILADGIINWPYSNEKFLFFFDTKGIFAHIPLGGKISRLMTARRGYSTHENPDKPTVEEVEKLAKDFTHGPVRISNPIWMSRFHLHHRSVNQYREGRAFLAGDAAHIHSPVGGQGMNTGFQDTANLAWKVAFVLRGISPEPLLDTYQSERLRIGQILLKTTDRIFSFATSDSFLVKSFVKYVMPFVVGFAFKSSSVRRCIFRFASQIGIRYHKSAFVDEQIKGADSDFLSGPEAGCRAPDAPLGGSTLFESWKGSNSCHILIFRHENTSNKRLKALEQAFGKFVTVDCFVKSFADDPLFRRYGVRDSAVYFVRPDGYIGFRSYGTDLSPLFEYLERFTGRQSGAMVESF